MNNNDDNNNLIARRRQYLQQLRGSGNAFPNDFKREHFASDLHADYADHSREALAENPITVSIAGRMMSRRVMGRTAFADLRDASAKIQLYLKRDVLTEDVYAEFKRWDIGDIIGANGRLMKTNKGELSVQADVIRLLTKSLRPLPEKFHGLSDQETRYRRRYVDLIMNEDTRRIFELRARVIDFIRSYLTDRRFMEVETPMMHVIPGGATARPFTTHHNSLDMALYLRIAPELYLKRLVIGGMERVFEINRSFRNEGLSPRHNPEFTMLEFYQAYADYHDMMDMTEDLMRRLVNNLTGSAEISYQGRKYDLNRPFTRLTVLDAILRFNQGMTRAQLSDPGEIRKLAGRLDIPLQDDHGPGKIQIEIFEKTVESKLMQPTFITAYPTEVSPLARRNDHDPSVADRFELFIGGREIANGFSELNDPEDQAGRFRQQAQTREAGEAGTLYFDEDYITALEYGMPPTAGEGVGIDRLVMLLTDSASIRDVILFPHMRPIQHARHPG